MNCTKNQAKIFIEYLYSGCINRSDKTTLSQEDKEALRLLAKDYQVK